MWFYSADNRETVQIHRNTQPSFRNMVILPSARLGCSIAHRGMEGDRHRGPAGGLRMRSSVVPTGLEEPMGWLGRSKVGGNENPRDPR